MPIYEGTFLLEINMDNEHSRKLKKLAKKRGITFEQMMEIDISIFMMTENMKERNLKLKQQT